MKKLTLDALLQSINEDSIVNSLIQSSPVCHKIFDPDFKLQFMSNSGVVALQIENVEDYYGHTFPTDSAPKFTRDIFNEHMRLAAKGETNTIEYSFEVDGNVIWFRTTLSPFFNTDGNLIYIKADSMDITDRKQAEKKQIDLALDLSKAVFKTQEAKHAAEVANRAKSTFLSNMSHEIRTPLNAILGYAQILQMNGSLDSKQREAVNTIETSGNHLLELINRILDISKIEAGQTELKLTDFNLTSLIEGLAIMFRGRCESKRLEFGLDGLDQEPIYVYGDEGKLRQVLVNLLGNAVKFTDQGKVSLKFIRAEGHKYIFKVKDTGPGISSDAKVKIFESFMQAEAGMHHGGTGLGLAISKELVELMGGKLLVDSQEGEGSCFSISLELPPAKKPVPPRSKRNRRTIKLSEKYCVKALVVDDVQVNRELLSEVLRTVGIETLEAESGKEALERLDEFEPHIIFMDRRMPVMNGEETVKAIIKKYGPDRFKIIAITAAALDHQRENFKLLGYDDYIVKPFRISHIHDCIQKLLDVEFEYEDERQESQKL